jgi:glycosyltransferase involved in cell wall biosynthesis
MTAGAAQHDAAPALRGGAALHVAAMPFPSHQGTQAAIAAMLAALARAERPVALLTYAHAGSQRSLPFPVLRSVEAVPFRSLRSGPSAHKLLADVALGRALQRERARLRPSLIVAHHVEAAALALRAPRRLFFAHTDLHAELPSYAHPAWAPLLAGLGERLDIGLMRQAHAVAAISPALAQRMRARLGTAASKVHYVPPPWPLPEPTDTPERMVARAALGLSGQRVLLYAGNLDRYQGWEPIVHALALLPELILLVGTQSDPARLLHEARSAGVAARVRLHAIDSEAARRCVHACADVAVVPRRSPGGLPIKLLDALARGVACVITETAGAGLPLGRAVQRAAADDAHALAHAVRDLLATPALHAALQQNGRSYIAEHHSDAAFLAAYDATCIAALAPPKTQS